MQAPAGNCTGTLAGNCTGTLWVTKQRTIVLFNRRLERAAGAR